MAKIKRPKDFNQRAKTIVDLATGEITESCCCFDWQIRGVKGGQRQSKKIKP
jgi:hypothetical protein